MNYTYKRLGIITAVLALVVVACASDGTGEEDGATTEVTAAPTETTTTAPQVTEQDETTTTTVAMELTEVSIMLDFLPGPLHLGIYAAQEEGLYEAEGLDVEIIEGRGSSTAASVVGTGAETFGLADASAVANAIGEEAPLKTVATILQRATSGLAFPCSAGVETPADLRGKSVAGSAGTANWNFLSALLQDFDMTLGEEVEQVIVDAGAQTAAVLSGQADARTTVAYDVRLQLEAEEEICTLIYADWGVVTLGHGIITTDEVIETQPEVVRSFVSATLKGYESAIDDPIAAREALVSRHPDANPEVIDLGWEEIPPFLTSERTEGCPLGWMHPDDWVDTLDFWEESEIIQTRLDDPSSYFTNEFHPDGENAC